MPCPAKPPPPKAPAPTVRPARQSSRPGDLNQLEKAEFIAVVDGLAAEPFLPADGALIAAYARAVVAERRAAGELDAAHVVSSPNGDRPSPWLPVWLGQLRACTTLGATVEHQSGRKNFDQVERAAGTEQFLRTHGLGGGAR